MNKHANIRTVLMRVLQILGVVFLPVFGVARALADSPFTAAQEAKLVSALVDSKPDARAQAHRFARSKSEEGKARYSFFLKQSEKLQRDYLDSTGKQLSTLARPFLTAYDDWNTQRSETLLILRQELGKDRRKQAELDRLYERTDRFYQAAIKALNATEKATEPLRLSLVILGELDRELAYCEGTPDAAIPNIDSLLDKCLYADEIGAWHHNIQTIRANEEAYREAGEWNQKRAPRYNEGQRLFARLVNQRRRAFAMTPLYLEARLCEACLSHSEEMKQLKYFAHESPTPANATPSKRAQNAHYTGAWRGENIYQGGGGPGAAFQGWWYSDGHRFIMFTDGVHHLGIAEFSTRWTMHIGDGKTPPDA